MFKKTFHVIKNIYTPLSLIALFYYCILNKRLITDIIELSTGAFLLFSILMWIFLHFLSPLAPKIIFGNLGSSLPYRKLLSIHINQIPARYLPGGIWHTVGRMSSYHLSGISKKNVAFYFSVETICPCIVTLFLGSSILLISELSTEKNIIWAITAIVQLLIMITIPFIVKFYRPLHFNKKNLSDYCLFLLLSFFYWFIATCSFIFYIQANSFISLKLELLDYFHIIGSYLFSWGVGYMAFFAPQGIGVFEVMAGKLIDLPIALSAAVVFIAGFRFIALTADIAIWSFFKIICALNKKNIGTS